MGTAKPHQTQQNQETSPGSPLPCGQGTPTATTDSQPQYNQMAAPPDRVYLPIIHQCTHSHHKHHLLKHHLLKHKIIHYLRIPLQLLRPQCPTLWKRKYQNHSMEKESRIAGNKTQPPQLIPKTVDSASDVNGQVT